MATSSLIIKSKDDKGKSLTKTITYINPEASASQIVQFAQMLNGLTTNTYIKSQLVDNTDIDTEDRPSAGGGAEKLTPTFKITAIDKYHGTYEYDGDGEVFGYESAGSGIIIDRTSKTWRVYKYTGLEEYYETQVSDADPVAPFAPVAYDPFAVVTLYASEGERYKAAVVSNA